MPLNEREESYLRELIAAGTIHREPVHTESFPLQHCASCGEANLAWLTFCPCGKRLHPLCKTAPHD